MVAILFSHLGNCESQKPNLQLIRDIDESDACMKFEQNHRKMRKLLIVKETRTLCLIFGENRKTNWTVVKGTLYKPARP